MISGLYSAATAMDVAAARHEVTAENLASAHLAGFRRRMLPQSTFESMVSRAPSNSPSFMSRQLGTTAQEVTHDFTQGRLTQTDRPLDIAISGDGFFGVDGPDGPLYTRNGSFYAGTDGTLMTVDQLPVRGTAGTIRIPGNVSSENVSVLPDGRLMADGVEFARLELTRFENNNALRAAGSSLYQAPATAGAEAADVMLQQGYLELSNVSAVSEMAEMISNSRRYDAAQKALNTIAESIQKRIGLQ